MAEDWTDEELAASIDAYREMEALEAARKPYNKRQIYRDLAAKFGRTDKAFEFRMQNISAVLNGLGKPWMPGLKPAANVGANVKARIVLMLERPAKTVRAESAPYKLKLPAMRDWLIAVARSEGMVTYGEVMDVFDIDRFSLRHAMDFLGHQADNRDEPIITALIVGTKTRRCSPGLAKEFDVQDDEAERRRLYEFWRGSEMRPSPVDPPQAPLVVKAARFASVEARPEQAAFRSRVFTAYGGRCVISGCDLGCALDAAHKHGRDWRLGHNRAEDGYLMRKDLHALYDNGHLRISDQGVVEITPLDLLHYALFHGVRISDDDRNAL